MNMKMDYVQIQNKYAILFCRFLTIWPKMDVEKAYNYSIGKEENLSLPANDCRYRY